MLVGVGASTLYQREEVLGVEGADEPSFCISNCKLGSKMSPVLCRPTHSGGSDLVDDKPMRVIHSTSPGPRLDCQTAIMPPRRALGRDRQRREEQSKKREGVRENEHEKEKG